jgi:hypothetical protein
MYMFLLKARLIRNEEIRNTTRLQIYPDTYFANSDFTSYIGDN